VQQKGKYFRAELEKLATRFPDLLSSARGMGLLVGAVLTEEGVSHGVEIVNKMFEKGFLMNFAGNVVLRFVPPLIVSYEEIDIILSALGDVLTDI
jgi:acetylornithine aminotransferase/acetylornithine/N-succinyldiaminopimelate aminotransferase